LPDAELLTQAASANASRPVRGVLETVNDVREAIAVLQLSRVRTADAPPMATESVAIIPDGDRAVEFYSWGRCLAALEACDPARPLLCWGAGARGRAIVKALASVGVNVHGFVDGDPSKAGTTLNGVPVHSPDLLMQPGSPRPFVLVASVAAPDIVGALGRFGFSSPSDLFVV